MNYYEFHKYVFIIYLVINFFQIQTIIYLVISFFSNSNKWGGVCVFSKFHVKPKFIQGLVVQNNGESNLGLLLLNQRFNFLTAGLLIQG